MKRKPTLLVAVVLLLVISIGCWWAYRDYQRRQAIALFKAIFSAPTEKPSWRRYLPVTATDVHEWSWADSFLPDYSYLLKARASNTEFQQFVMQLGLAPHKPDRKYSEDLHWLSWGAAPGFHGDWWDASPDLTTTYVIHHEVYILAITASKDRLTRLQAPISAFRYSYPP